MKKKFIKGVSNDLIYAPIEINRQSRKFVAILLIVGILASLLPQPPKAYAYPFSQDQSTDPVETDRVQYASTTDPNFDISSVAIVGEVDSMRTESSKTFQRMDGSFVAAMYGDVVHYQKDGQWTDVDNSLSYRSEDDSYRTKENSFQVTFPKNIEESKKIQLTMGEYAIDWSVYDIARSVIDCSVSVAKPTDTKELTGISQEIRYAEIRAGVDLQYIVSGSKIKENILLDQYIENFSLMFEYTLQNLKLVNENGNISFVNESGKMIFGFEDLYAFDASGDVTFDLSLSVVEIKKGAFQITISVDDEWLRKATYPVTIDPTLSNVSSQITVRDSFVDQTFHEYNFSTNTSLMLSYTTSNSLKRGLLNFTFPSILAGKVITYASLSLTANNSYKTTGRTLGLYANNQTFDMTAVTWDSYVANITQSTSMTDYHVVGSGNTYKFDITKKVKEWQDAGYTLVPGFTIKDKNSFGARNDVYSVEYATTSSRPVLEIGFIDPAGIKDYWTYSSQDIGLAGTGYVSDLSGTLTIVRNDLSFSSAKQSFGLSMIYSVPMKDVNIGYGNGWRTNYDMNVTYDGTVGRYAVIDSSSSKEYYQPIDVCERKFEVDENYGYACFDAEDGSGNVLVVETDGILNGYVNYLVWNPEDVYYRFNAGGYLYEITDMNTNNQLTVTVHRETASPYRIDYITDEVGNKIDLTFDIYGNLGNATLQLKQENNTLGRIIAQTEYTMGAANRLVGVAFKGDMNVSAGMSTQGIATYAYTSTNLLTYAQTDDATRVSYSINATTKRVDSITTSFDGINIASVYYAYSMKKTVITDQFNNWILYKFDDFGHTVNITDSKGTTQSFQYLNLFKAGEGESIFVDEDGTPNYLYNHHLIGSSLPIPNENNPVINGSFEFDLALSGDGWTLVHDSGTNSSFSRSTSFAYLDNYSGVIGNAPSNTAHVEQTITLDAGIYTLSAYVKNVTGTSDVSIEINGASYEGPAATAPADSEWHLIKVLFVVESDDTSVTASLVNHCINGGGAYFDGVQIYEGFTEANVNLIENPSFEFAEGSWIPGWSTLATGITRTTLTYDSEIYSTILGTYGIRIQGLASTARSYEIDSQNATNGQRITVLSDVMTIGGWAKSEGTPTSLSNGDTDRFFRIKVGMYDSGNNPLGSFQYVDFDPSITGWQCVYSSIAMEAGASYLRIWVEYKGEGYVWFDNLGTFAQTTDTLYEYSITEAGAPQTTITEPDGAQTIITFKASDIYSSTPKIVSADGHLLNIDTEDPALYTYEHDNVTFTFTINADGVVTTRSIGDDTEEYFSSSSTLLSTGFGQYHGSSSDEFGNETSYEYNAVTGLLEAIENAKSIQTRYIYDDFGNVIGVDVTDAQSTVYGSVVYGYDTLGRLNKIWLDYDAYPNLYYEIHYDELSRMESVTIGSTVLMGYTYKVINGYETNLLETQTYGNLDQISFTYNSDNLVKSISFKESPDSSFVQLYGYEYSQSGQLAVKTTFDSADGTSILNREYYAFDSMGRISRIYDEQGHDYTYGYDEDGNLIEMDLVLSDSIEQGIIYEYNEEDRLDSIIYDAINGTSVTKNYVYSTEALKMLDEIALLYTSSTVVTTGFVYEGYTSRLHQINFDVAAQNGTDYRFRYSYDELGNITLVSSFEASTLITQDYFSYDKLNQLVLEAHYVAGATGYAIAYEYDARGNRTATTKYTFPSTTFPQYSFNYNGLHEANAIVNGEWAVNLDLIPLEIDDTTTLNFIIYDLSTGVPVESAACTVTLVAANLDTSVPGFYQTTYNATDGSTIDYDFNVRFFVGPREVGSQTVIESVTYSYDATWIDLLRSYQIELGNDDYTTTFTYEGTDDQGTPSVITKYLNSVVSEVIDLTWSGRNLTSYTVYSDLAETTELYSLTFTYNDQGYRTSKTYASSSENYTIQYTLLGSQVLYETDGTYGIYYTYDVQGNIISFNYDEQVSSPGDGEEYFYLRSLQGDVYAILDSTGQVVVKYVYDAYGNILDETEVATGYQFLFAANPYTYRGYRFDRETGLYYLQSRYYDSEMGRFINVDLYNVVSDEILRTNQFSYSINNPINYTDYCGTSCLAAFNESIEKPTICGQGGGGGLFMLLGLGAKELLLLVAVTSAIAVTKRFVSNLDEELRVIFLSVLPQMIALAQLIVKAASKVKPRNTYELHHIVAQNDSLAMIAQTILAFSGIDINHPLNTVLIKYEYHRVMHSIEYYSFINFALSTAWNSSKYPSISKLAVMKTLGTLNAWLSMLYGVV